MTVHYSHSHPRSTWIRSGYLMTPITKDDDGHGDHDDDDHEDLLATIDLYIANIKIK